MVNKIFETDALAGFEIDALAAEYKINLSDLARNLGITNQRLKRLRNLEELPKFEAMAIKYFFAVRYSCWL